MNRVAIVMSVIVSLLLGGVVFGVGSGQAAPGDDPWAQPFPTPQGPKPPKPPKPPRPPRIVGPGISISIHGNQIHIDGLDQLVANHLQNVRNMLQNNPNLPKDVRDKIVQRMDKVKGIVDKYVKNLDTQDLDKLDGQLGRMGDELEKALEGLDADLSKLGDQLGKDLAKDITRNLRDMKFRFGPHPQVFQTDDDDNDNDSDTDTDDDDLPNASIDSDIDIQAAVSQLKDFALKPAQKDQIQKLRATADAKVERARRQLDEASRRLEGALANPATSDADIERYVDQITAHEAAIRKARLLSWMQARRVLDPDQVKQLEAAAHRTK